jgi:hypothetical protein
MRQILSGLAVVTFLLMPFSGYAYQDGDWQYCRRT